VRYIIFKNYMFSSFYKLYIKYDCSLYKCISIMVLLTNILALASSAFMQWMHKYNNWKNLTSVISAAEFTHSHFDSHNWYCGLYNYISLYIMLPEEPTCANILSMAKTICMSE